MGRARRASDRAGAWRAGLAVVAVVAAGTGVAIAVREGVVPVPAVLGGEGCTAVVDGHEVELSVEQAENAALISAVSVRRGMPARAASIALATAYQESKLENIDYGDRDSLGLFQQRPSQGWGSEEQVMDPYYATNAFYDELAEVDGYRDMRITDAAQEVQRSGFPEAYEDHAEDGRALASALTGYSPASFTCQVDLDAEEEPDRLGERGLTPRAATVADDVEAAFGDLPLGGFAPGGVSSGHSADSAHYDGRAVDIFFRPIGPESLRQGWAVAQYLVAHADRLDVETVIFDDRIWTARRSSQGWRDYGIDTGGVDPDTAAILEHRDHVHVDVAD